MESTLIAALSVKLCTRVFAHSTTPVIPPEQISWELNPKDNVEVCYGECLTKYLGGRVELTREFLDH